MPFTLFHLGPGLGLGLVMKHIHAPTFSLANIFVNVKPFLVLLLGLNYPLHGYLHPVTLVIPAAFSSRIILTGYLSKGIKADYSS